MRQYASVSHSMSKNEAIIMEDFILIRPTSEYAGQLAEYRQEFLDADSSMDGCGPLRRFEDPIEYIQECKNYENPETVPSHLVPATQFLFVRRRDNRLVGMIQVRHCFNDFLEKYAGHSQECRCRCSPRNYSQVSSKESSPLENLGFLSNAVSHTQLVLFPY